VEGNSLTAKIQVSYYRGKFQSLFGPVDKYDLTLSGNAGEDTFKMSGHIFGWSEMQITIEGQKQADLVKEAELLCDYHIARRANSNAAVTQEFIEFYMATLEDDNVELDTRLQLINNLRGLFNNSKTDNINALVFKAVSLLDQLKKAPSDRNSVHTLMYRMFKITDRTDDWKAAAKSLIRVTDMIYNQRPENFNFTWTYFRGIFCIRDRRFHKRKDQGHTP